jgi:ubiquinone/menaquinone biosynthesis C-methylase UbiE
MIQNQDLNVSCILCGSSDFMRLYKTNDKHYGIKGEYYVCQCNCCELTFIDPMPSEDELTGMYPNDFYAYQDFFEDKKNINIIKTTIRKILLLNIGTKDPKFEKPGRILDIGCGSGKFLYNVREKGWEVYGVEVNRNAAELGRNAAGINIFAGNLLEANFPDNYFNYIRSNHSFEHIVNPHEILDEIYRILKPGGSLLVGVPNVNGINSKIFKSYWWYRGVPVHPYGYSVSTLSRILEEHNFKFCKVTYNSDYSGILGSIQIYLNRNNNKLSNEGLAINNIFLHSLFQRISKLFDFFKIGDAIEIIGRK